MTLIAEVRLHLNPAESQIHVPEWRSMPVPWSVLLPISNMTPFHIINGKGLVKMLNGDLIPWRQDSIKVLGCPLDSRPIANWLLRKMQLRLPMKFIEQNFALLKEFQ